MGMSAWRGGFSLGGEGFAEEQQVHRPCIWSNPAGAMQASSLVRCDGPRELLGSPVLPTHQVHGSPHGRAAHPQGRQTAVDLHPLEGPQGQLRQVYRRGAIGVQGNAIEEELIARCQMIKKPGQALAGEQERQMQQWLVMLTQLQCRNFLRTATALVCAVFSGILIARFVLSANDATSGG